jgi:hypothetical protein
MATSQLPENPAAHRRQGAFVPAVSPRRAESDAHRRLKALALEWARERRLVLAVEEVRLPRCAYRADVAATTPRVLTDAACTAVFECKASRADFLRDSAPEDGASAEIAGLAGRLRELRTLIAGHRPDLRRGEELFAEYDAYDLRGLRHETHDRLEAELRVAQRKFHEGTKFSRLGRWRAASLLYVVAEEDVVEPYEVPDGWGLLVRRGEALELVLKPCLNPTTAAERVALLERIAAAGGRLAHARAIIPGRGQATPLQEADWQL